MVDSGKEEMMSGELYDCFKDKTELGYTSFYEMVNRLEGLKLITLNNTGKGTRGRAGWWPSGTTRTKSKSASTYKAAGSGPLMEQGRMIPCLFFNRLSVKSGSVSYFL